MKRRKRNRLPGFFELVSPGEVFFLSAVVFGVYWFFLRPSNSLSAWCNTNERCTTPWCKVPYDATIVAKSIRQGALNYNQWLPTNDAQRQAFIRSLGPQLRQRAYYSGYIIPWTHGLEYGRCGQKLHSHINASHRSSRQRKYYAECGTEIPYDLWLDQRRGAREGESGVG
jgi:hypothetical protein